MSQNPFTVFGAKNTSIFPFLNFGSNNNTTTPIASTVVSPLISNIFAQQITSPQSHVAPYKPLSTFGETIIWSNQIKVLRGIEKTLKTTIALTPEIQKEVFNQLKQVDCWGNLCGSVYCAFENTDYDRSSPSFGEDLIKSNPLVLVYIRDKNNNDLIQQSINNLEEKIVIQNKINKLRELESLLKQSPKNCTLEKVRNLFRENYQIAKDLALIVKDDSLVASIFHPTTTQDPTLLLNSNGKNWIQELTKTYEEQQKHTSFTHEKKDLNAINARQPFKAWQYRNRREQLLAFSAQLKKQPELELSTLRQSYRELDAPTRKNIEHYVCTAFGMTNGEEARDKILFQPRLLLSILDNQERDILTALASHLQLKEEHVELKFKLAQFEINYANNTATLESLDTRLRNSLAYWAWNNNKNIDGMELLNANFKSKTYIIPLLNTLKKQLDASYSQLSLKVARKKSEKQKDVSSSTCKDITYKHLQKEIKPEDFEGIKKVALITAEFQNIVSSGGLGMAVLGMAEAETKRGIKVDVVMPLSVQIPDRIKNKMTEAFRFQDRYMGIDGKQNRVLTLSNQDTKELFPQFAGNFDNITFLFIEDTGAEKSRFNREALYTGDVRDLETYMYFSYCAARIANENLKPDVVHAHDWSTAFVPTVLQKMNSTIPSVVTIHNNLVQGKVESDFAKEVLSHCGFPKQTRNLMVDALHSAQQVTTVSENYAEEIQSDYFGQGIQYELRKIAFIDEKLTGIVNGSNLAQFDTDKPVVMAFRDPVTQQNIGNQLTFGPNSSPQEIVQKKMKIKGLLQTSLTQFQQNGMYKDVVMDFKKPYALNVGRFDPAQKGMQNFKHMVEACLASGVQIVIMGPKPASHEKEALEYLRELKEYCKGKQGVWIIEDEKRPDGRFKIQQGPDAMKAFADLNDEDKKWPSNVGMMVRAGSEFGILPPNFEPCGLTQDEFKNTGTEVIARAVGGIPDTVPPNMGVLYKPVDPYSKEQFDILKYTIQQFCAERKKIWEGALNGDAEAIKAYGSRAQEILKYGRRLAWDDSPNEKPSPIDQYRMVYATAKKRMTKTPIVHVNTFFEGKKITLQPV